MLFLRASAVRFLPFVLLIGACASPAREAQIPDVLIRQDFESLGGWVSIGRANARTALLSTRVAHSGRCAARVGGVVEYGLGFTSPLGRLTKRRPEVLEISYWCYRLDAGGNGATLVCAIEHPSTRQQLHWQAANLSKEVSRNRTWTRITQRIEIPAQAEFSDVLHFYPWRGAATSEVYFDDIEVRLLPK